jgi:hypothetical protein
MSIRQTLPGVSPHETGTSAADKRRESPFTGRLKDSKAKTPLPLFSRLTKRPGERTDKQPQRNGAPKFRNRFNM